MDRGGRRNRRCQPSRRRREPSTLSGANVEATQQRVPVCLSCLCFGAAAREGDPSRSYSRGFQCSVPQLTQMDNSASLTVGDDMRNQQVKALTISRWVFDLVRESRLTGHVRAKYEHACNLVISEQEIIALVSPAIGNGPLNIVIEDNAAFEHVTPGLSAVFRDGQLILGDALVVLLDGARLWNAEVNWERLTAHKGRLGNSLAVLCDWLLNLDAEKQSEEGNGIRPLQSQAFLTTAWARIRGLLQALQHGDRPGIRENVAHLAGLGPGLTPAGDDYLVGLMAGLRAWPTMLEDSGLSPGEACQIMFEATKGKTTLLSNAFLRSAKDGLFGESWHELLAALAGGEAPQIQRAARHILSSGATSGADALVGFLSPYLI